MNEEKDINIEIIDGEVTESEIENVATANALEDAVEASESDTEAKPQTETMEYIVVEEAEEIEVGVDEAFVATNGVIMPKHTHGIGEIERLNGILDTLGSAREYYSPSGGYAEFRQWSTSSGGEVARFVSLVYKNKTDNITGGNTFIEVCSSENKDVYGVTVGESALCGYQNKEYCILGESADNSSSSNFAKVCLLGVVSVRQGANYKNAKVGDYVVPDDNGCAVLSENGIGFRVVGVGQRSGATDDYWNFAYVNIALVPQNDNVARVMAELEGTRQDLGGLSIQIGKLENDINDSITSIIPGMNETIEDLNGIINGKLNAATEALDTAQKISSEAKQTIDQVAEDYAQAKTDAEAAKEAAQNALTDVTNIANNMTVLKQHEDKIVGFFNEANNDKASLATLVKQTGDITLINQKIDENGAVIQHLVAHADKYSVGEYSPTYGLTYKQALGILGQTGPDEASGYIYVPTQPHTEESTVYNWLENKMVTFEKEKAYVWKRDSSGPDDSSHRWQETNLKVALGDEPTERAYGDLWYTWNGVVENDVWVYEPQTLYRWTAYNETDGVWIAVARANDGNARAMSFINQTAGEISSTVTDLGKNITNITQKVNAIESQVSNSDSGALSQINQTAEAITLGTYSPNKGVSSLEILLNGMRSTTSYNEHIKVGEFGGSIASGITKYETPPIWGDNGFDFAEGAELIEEKYPAYYFDSDKRTYYCKQTDDDTYEIYTIGNQAMANISTRVDDNESAIESWTQFESETKKALSSITQTSDKDAAELVAMVLGEYKYRAVIQDNITEEERQSIGDRYNEMPTWNKQFIFAEDLIPSENGLYCIPTNSGGKYYWKLLLDSDSNIIGYEKYEMKESNYASLMQKTSDDGSEISLIAGNNNVEGGIFVKAINGSTSATINADKIAINGTTTFADVLNPEKTAISGNYIKTGVIMSNNYNGPVTYRMYGVTIGTDDNENAVIVPGGLSDCIYYSPIVDGEFSCTEKEYSKYYTAEIEVGVQLFKGQQPDGEHKSEYIVCDKDFDLQPSDIETQGTKFDLNVGTIYSKNFSLDREGDLAITGKISATSGYIGDSTQGIGFNIDKTEVENEDGTKTNYYYLANDQVSLRGTQKGGQGVYLSPLGLGLGNGNFYIDNLGNVTMKGSIVLDGSISWGVDNSPVLVLYAKTALVQPTKNQYDEIVESESNGTINADGWHTTFTANDYYATYSYNGGSSWTEAVRIQGKNGSSGSDGKDADLSDYPWIQKTYIDFEQIESPQIKGNFIIGGEVYGGSFWNTNKTAYIKLGTTADSYADFSLYRKSGKKIFSIEDHTESIVLKGESEDIFLTTSGDKTNVHNKWDFSKATVTGLTSTAVFG